MQKVRLFGCSGARSGGIAGASEGSERAPTGGIARAITVEWGGSDFSAKNFSRLALGSHIACLRQFASQFTDRVREASARSETF